MKKINEEPLVWSASEKSEWSNREGSLYFGVGLTARTELSVGLPFDCLGMILTAEWLRRACDLKKVIVLVADQHAIDSWPDEVERIRELEIEYREIITKAGAMVGMPLQVIRASELSTHEAFREILTDCRVFPEITNEYVCRQTADVMWFEQREHLRLKLGWLTDPTKDAHDERVFDKAFLEKNSSSLVRFAYTGSGKTMDGKRPNAPPYIATASVPRILLKQGFSVSEYLSGGEPKMRDRMCLHIRSIISLWNALSPSKVHDEVFLGCQQLVDLLSASS